MNLVEMCSDEQAFDQPCKFGNRVETHSVYCHNEEMNCMKCRRTWYTGGEDKDEDCPGYVPNPEYKETT